jgi:hypothetical protein
MMLNIEQKKGDPGSLDGRIVVYAIIDVDPEDLVSMKHSFASMVHNGLLVAQGNFKDQYNFRDFLKSELGISMEEGLEEGLSELISRMDGIESTLDPQKLKERLENMDDLEDFIPTPAKIVPFHSETEILDQEGDIFFAGRFRNIGNAVLTVQALPMLYQARYREQEAGHIRGEIESIIAQIERSGGDTPVPAMSTEEALLRKYIPDMIYHKNSPHDFDASVKEFRSFMRQYRFGDDVESIVALISGAQELSERDNRLLELFAKKISCIEREDFAAAEEASREIERVRKGTGE